jgi:hypothetical protein
VFFITLLQGFLLGVLNLGHRLVLVKEFDSAPVHPPPPVTYLVPSQLQQFASVQKNRIKNTKEIVRSSCHKVHVVEHSLDSSGDESSEVLTAEFFWPSKTKSLTCDALKPIHKDR